MIVTLAYWTGGGVGQAASWFPPPPPVCLELRYVSKYSQFGVFTCMYNSNDTKHNE